ncbi:hypothetical protein J2X47_000559 [Sphingomonas sp. BE270]|uniref:hypothetical protein n=1 Tax=Sphingomonas sp. BE270 TaxID=2817726 RepID=UPI00285A604A|nr:hypothetical protein [Sphingomonas sp. BE270]MDR7256398.1 hypothetical protein [Sphingomonas sp. BE270]
MTIAPDIAPPESAGALETAARHHLDSARGYFDEMNGVAGNPSHERTERAFWDHMNAAWQIIQRVDHARHSH